MHQTVLIWYIFYCTLYTLFYTSSIQVPDISSKHCQSSIVNSQVTVTSKEKGNQFHNETNFSGWDSLTESRPFPLLLPPENSFKMNEKQVLFLLTCKSTTSNLKFFIWYLWWSTSTYASLCTTLPYTIASVQKQLKFWHEGLKEVLKISYFEILY